MTQNNKLITVSNSSSELFSLANTLRKTGLSQKEAFADARKIIVRQTLRNELMKKMTTSVVTISFKNRKGKIESGKCTLCPSEIPSRKIGGAKTSKNENWLTCYDKVHGMYRSFLVDQIVDFSR